MIRGFLSLWLCASVVVLAGCAGGPRLTQPVRAIWVTRFDYKTAVDVTQIMENCADAGFNAVVFQVRGNGTAFYRSRHEPWAEQFEFRDPGFDPLELAVRETRARGLELHAWVNVMPAWRGTTPPAHPDQLYHKHPEWFWYDQHGGRQALSSFYVSLNPCLPEVRDYLVEVFRDLVARYEVDGLHMDYIRFPNEPPATPRGSGLDFPRDARTLALYHEATGQHPDDDRGAWDRWRTECVTRLVADIHRMIRRTRPRAALTAAVGSVRANALTHFQDARRWIDDGLVDAVFLMNYTDSPDTFAERLTPWLDPPPRVPVIPGMWFGRHEGKPVEEATAAVRRQIEVARERTGSFCVFAYSSLFESADDRELSRRTLEELRIRAVRREFLLPFLRSLAAPRRGVL